MKLAREFFIPKNSTKVADKQSDAVAYLFTNSKGKPAAKVFYGKQSKPVAFYYFQTEAARETSVKGYFEARRAKFKRDADESAKRKAFVNPYKVGDIFKSSWGYDQTNVDWYEVTEVSGKMLTVREIGTESVDTGNMSGRCIPLPGKFIGKPIRKLAQDGYIRINSFSSASYQKPQLIAGVKVYRAASWSSYA